MSMPQALVWGAVPDDEARDQLRREIRKTVHGMKPPMPPRYADDLTEAIMEKVEGWDWWRMRWYRYDPGAGR